MKPFKEVEQGRQQYHSTQGINSVHRSSLLVPELAGAEAIVSLLNHFLVKRGYDNVACRITGIDSQGNKMHSVLHKLEEPRVYNFNLSRMFEGKAASYGVEFFCAENLFFPYPAVMVNHTNAKFLNSVHAFNRVMNDVFENDVINANKAVETSIDVKLGDGIDTFFLLYAGPLALKENVHVELMADGRRFAKDIPTNVPRFTHRMVSLKETFPEAGPCRLGTLKVHLPTQFLFYNRMLGGHRLADGTFTANHSYYDCSHVTETWENDQPSSITYPFFAGLRNVIRVYPTMSPGTLEFEAVFYRAGDESAPVRLGKVTSPGGAALELNLSAVVQDLGWDPATVSSFAFIAKPVGGHTPTRVSHQLIYGVNDLEGSINCTLFNPNNFRPKKSEVMTWGQTVVGGGYNTRVGVCTNYLNPKDARLRLRVYGEGGLLLDEEHSVKSNRALHFDVEKDILPKLARGAVDASVPNFLWYYVTTPDLESMYAYASTIHRDTGYCTAEHSF